MTLTHPELDTEPGYDRTPPQDLPAEKAVLGAMLMAQYAIADVSEILTPADFYRPAHGTIYTALLDLYAAGEPADAVTVARALQKTGDLTRTGGAPYLHELMRTVTTPASAGYHAAIVREHGVRRRLVEAGIRITQMGYTTSDGSDLTDLVDRAQAETFALAAPGRQRTTTNADSVARVLAAIENPAIPGVPTGFTDFDELTGGLHPGQLVVVAGRPGMGKSTWAMDVNRNTAIKHGRHAAFFSLEMNQDEITKRTLSAESAVPLHHLKHGCMDHGDWERLARVTGRVSGAPLHVDDSPDLTMMSIRTKARRLKQQHDLRLITVDYLQLMNSGTGKRHENRQMEVAAISRGLKLLAKELEVPVIAVAQLNRGPEQRTDKKPFMSDLRESGSIEADADVVILIHREDAYERESPRAGEADLIVAKHRGGPTATITVAFQGHYSRFVDMAQS